MNALKASIGQLKYRHIFELIFSCCFLYYTELDAVFVLCQDSPATEFSNALVPGKKASIKGGSSDCLFDFFIRKFWRH